MLQRREDGVENDVDISKALLEEKESVAAPSEVDIEVRKCSNSLVHRDEMTENIPQN